MKQLLALSTLLLSGAAAQATMNVRMSLALHGAEAARTMAMEFNLEANQPVRLSSQSFEIDVVAQAVENEIELAFAINTKNEDGSYTLVATPVVRTACNKTAVVTMADEDNTTLGMLITVQENVATTAVENQEAQ